jgi:glycosyltransferase involved in cell wall biosynthesis
MGLVKSSSLVVEVTHITEIYGPAQALENYLRKNTREFIVIAHPLPSSSLNYSICKVYTNDELRKDFRYRTFRFLEIVSYMQHFLLTLFILMKIRKKIDIYIGIDNLNAFVGILLRKVGFVNKVIFYVIDYTPKRFENKIFNALYYLLDVICAKNADYIWSVSKRIARIWANLGIEYRKNIIVPIGVELREIRKLSDIRRNVLVFVSHLTRSKGVQLAIEAMEDITKKFPEVMLEVIGTGPFEKELMKIVKRKRLEDKVKFLGAMDHERLMQYLPTCGIALATYEPDPNSITYYADPTKPKEYLACGLPVIITRVPWIAEEIEKRPMGIAISYDKKELVNAVVKLLSDDIFYELCKRNTIEFVSELDWNKVFDEAFSNCCKGS